VPSRGGLLNYIVINSLQSATPLNHHFDLFAAFLEYRKLIQLFVERSLIG
jgi:hypothetical protein